MGYQLGYRNPGQGIAGPACNPFNTLRHETADRGNYFTATTGSTNFGSGLACAIQTSFSATVALLTIRNGALQSNYQGMASNAGTFSSLDLPSIVPDYIDLICRQAPASTTHVEFAIYLDTPTAARDSSGTVLTGAPTDSQKGVDSWTSNAVINFNPTLGAASSAAQLVHMGVMRYAIPVVGDVYRFVFGDTVAAQGGGEILSGTSPQFTVINVPSVVISPPSSVNGQSQFHTMLLHVWLPGNATTAAKFEAVVGYFER